MMTLYTATRRHVIKIDFMYLIIQCKNISCNKFLFFKKKRKYFDDKKNRIYGMLLTMPLTVLLTMSSNYAFF